MKYETPELTVLNRALFYLEDGNYEAVRKILTDAALKLHDALPEEPEGKTQSADIPEWMKQPRFSCVERIPSLPAGSWQCSCFVNGLWVTHSTGSFCGKCGSYAPGCQPVDVRDVELKSLRSAWQAQKHQTEELREILRNLFSNGYRIKGSFGEMLDNPAFRKAIASQGTLEGDE